MSPRPRASATTGAAVDAVAATSVASAMSAHVPPASLLSRAFPRFGITPVALLSALFLAVMLVPANLYRLPSVLPFDVELYRLAVMLVLLAWGTGMLIDPSVRLRSTPIDTPMVLFATAITASLVRNAADLTANGEFDVALKALVYLTSLIAIFYAIVSLVRDARTATRLAKLVVAVGAVLGALAVVERLTGYNLFRHLHQVLPFLQTNDYGLGFTLVRGGLRVSGSTEHPIAFGTMLALVLPFGLQLMLDAETPRSKATWYVASSLVLIGMLLSVSRTAFLGLAVTALSFAYFRPKQRKALLFGLVVIGFAVHMAFPGVINRFIEGLSPSYIIAREVGNRAGRLEDYPRIWAEFVNKPLFGRGVGTFSPELFFYVDNQYLKFLVEIGIAGIASVALLFLTAAGTLLRAGRRLASSNGSLAVAAATTTLIFAVSSATFDTFGFPQPTHLFFMLLALGIASVANSGDAAAPAAATSATTVPATGRSAR